MRAGKQLDNAFGGRQREARARASGTRFYSLLGIPGAALLTAMFLTPIFVIVISSFAEVDVINRPILGTFTFDNYRDALQVFYIPIIVRTLVYAFLTTVACLLLGYPIAYYASRLPSNLGDVIMGILLTTWLLDYVVRLYAWKTILDDQGALNSLLIFVGLSPIKVIGTSVSVLVGLVYGFFPIAVLPIYSSLKQIDRQVFEAANDLYARPWRVFRRVTLPLSQTGTIAAAVLVFLPAIGDFATAQILGSPKQAMMGNFIYDQVANGGLMPVGAAETVLMFCIVILFVLICWLVARGAVQSIAGVSHD